MEWTFSIGWLFGGLAIMIASACLIIFHKPIADNLMSGYNSYNKLKLAGIIGVILGLICMTNLHSVILYGIFHLIMPTVFP